MKETRVALPQRLTRASSSGERTVNCYSIIQARTFGSTVLERSEMRTIHSGRAVKNSSTRERESDPDLALWDDCVKVCAELDYAKLSD